MLLKEIFLVRHRAAYYTQNIRELVFFPHFFPDPIHIEEISFKEICILSCSQLP